MGRTENVELTVLCLIEDGDKILLQNYVVPSPVTLRVLLEAVYDKLPTPKKKK